MSIILATRTHIQACIKINSEFGTPYDHPEWFIAESIEHGRVFVAEERGIITGYLLYQILWGNTPFLSLIKVSKKFQHQGIGQLLLQFFLKEMKKLGYKKVISSAEKVNEQGQKFHHRNNFVPIGELQMLYGDELFYSKNL